MTEVAWTAAGLDRARRLRFASLEPAERLAIAEELLELAVASGALTRLRARRQRDVDERWARTDSTAQTGTETSG